MRLLDRLITAALAAVAIVFPVAAAHSAPLPMLHAKGTAIVDSRGSAVQLRGVNLGGWLVEEPWMQPFVTKPPDGSSYPPIKDHVSLWSTVEKRLGKTGEANVRTAFRNAWVNESDFARIHAAGLNCVRVPFLASLLDEPNGVAWLDKAVAWAAANHLYVILDLHGAPGGQSDQGHTGEAGRDEFFKNPANVTAAVALWTKLAHHFKGNPTVAAYDLLNEPTGTPNSDTLYVVEDRLYRAVRIADPTHLVIIEDGYTGLQWMPMPGPCGWTNVVYNSHNYAFKSKTEADQRTSQLADIDTAAKQQARCGVPFYIGEFALEPHGTADTLSAVLAAMRDQHISWTMWTYKIVRASPGQSLWELYENSKPVAPLDPYTDTEATLIAKCAALRTTSLAVNPAVAQAFLGASKLVNQPPP